MQPAPIRKRLHRREVPGQARFLTFSCYRRLQLFSTPAIRDVFVEHLEAARAKHAFQLFAWVVMPEHVHLLLCPHREHADVAEITRSIKQPVAQRIIARWRELNARVLDRIRVSDGPTRFWQSGGGFDRNVRSESEFLRELWYIHMNPVTRGLVTHPASWAWSSATAYLGAPHPVAIQPSDPVRAWVRRRLQRLQSRG